MIVLMYNYALIKVMDYSSNEDIIEYLFGAVKNFILPSEKNNYKSKFLESNALLFCVVLLLVLKITTIFISINIPQNLFFADITKSTLESFVNQTRQSLGLHPLAENSKLDQAAQLKAENMVTDNYFAHTSPTGISPWYWFSQVGYNYKYAGENLAIGFFDSEEVYNAWLNSPEHKANIVNPNYSEIGTAVLNGYGGNNTIVVVQEFGSQKPVKTVVANNNSKPAQAIRSKNPVAAQESPAPVKASPEASASQAVTVSGASQKVLSQSTESKSVIESGKPASSNIYSVIYNYSGWLQNIIYGVSSVVIGVLLILIFFNFNFDFRKKLVFRSVLLVVLLSLATLINKEFLASIIPHQMII